MPGDAIDVGREFFRAGASGVYARDDNVRDMRVRQEYGNFAADKGKCR